MTAEAEAPSPEEVREAAAEVLSEPDSFVCESCLQEFPTRRALAAHLRVHKGDAQKTRSAKSAAPPRVADQALAQVGQKFQENVEMVGWMGAALLPHTGLTVKNRAAIIAEVALEQARRDERVLRLMIRFNTFMSGGKAGEVVASVGLAASIDLGMVDAHAEYRLGGMVLTPSMLIGDVIEEIDQARAKLEQQQAYLQAQGEVVDSAPQKNGRRGKKEEAEVIKGGVEKT